MKKLILGFLAGIIIATPVSVVAARVIEFPYTNTIYNISPGKNTISVFDDADNKCYLATSELAGYSGGSLTAISCVKTEGEL